MLSVYNWQFVCDLLIDFQFLMQTSEFECMSHCQLQYQAYVTIYTYQAELIVKINMLCSLASVRR